METKNVQKKILMVTEAFGSGVFIYLYTLCNLLVDTYDIYILHSTQRAETPADYVAYFDPRIHLVAAKELGRGSIWNVATTAKAISELRRVEKEIKPDIIHLHSSIAGGIGRLAFHGKTNVIYSPHGYSFLVGAKGVKRHLYHLMEKLLAPFTPMTLAISESELEVAKKLSKQTFCIENGIDTHFIDNSLQATPGNQHPNKPFTVYTVGRIALQKQPAIFNAIAEIVPQARFLWIGDGELRGELTSSNLEITGWLERDKALQKANNADLFMLCSMGEGLSLCLLENMYMGKLVLVSDVIGNRDVVHSGINGFVCDKPQDFAKHIKTAMNNYPQNIAKAAHDDVVAKYTLEIMLARYTNFYDTMIEAQTDRRG